jgi:rod shape-determining protein MreD
MSSNFPLFVLSLLAALVLQVVGLPGVLDPFQPLWLPLVLGYWALFAGEMPVLFAAWLLGLCCDVLYNAPLGQYALGLVTVAFLVCTLRGTLLSFPLWQSTLALIPVWTVYIFLMFWIDGLIARHPSDWIRALPHHSGDAVARWLPLLSTSLLWPLAAGLFGEARNRRSHRGMLP